MPISIVEYKMKQASTTTRFEETYEKIGPELKFSHKWLERKHVISKLETVQVFKDEITEKELGGQEVPTLLGTIRITKGKKTRAVVDLQALVEYFQKHFDKLKEDDNVVKKVIDRVKALIADLQASDGVV
ncbi:hypothetical protein PVK06_034742 [Gossypium arboreum]|uniref:Uncharacterized protein n=1 Tax=Gossypium arboreum TaxID=29729 RepID=A0ABR0NF29_GOSAR|nr:hypothetical protein PVK06_034742 [Gossypium arboreum]